MRALCVYSEHLQVSRDSPRAASATNATGWTGPSQDRPGAGGSLRSGDIHTWSELHPWHYEPCGLEQITSLSLSFLFCKKGMLLTLPAL